MGWHTGKGKTTPIIRTRAILLHELDELLYVNTIAVNAVRRPKDAVDVRNEFVKGGSF
jgi:hypothetical protein